MVWPGAVQKNPRGVTTLCFETSEDFQYPTIPVHICQHFGNICQICMKNFVSTLLQENNQMKSFIVLFKIMILDLGIALQKLKWNGAKWMKEIWNDCFLRFYLGSPISIHSMFHVTVSKVFGILKIESSNSNGFHRHRHHHWFSIWLGWIADYSISPISKLKNSLNWMHACTLVFERQE